MGGTLTSRKKILLGCVSMLLAMIGDYLLGFVAASACAEQLTGYAQRRRFRLIRPFTDTCG